MDVIWKQKRNTSVVDKLSYHDMLTELEKIEKIFIETNNNEFLDFFKENNEKHLPLSQTLLTMKEEDLSHSIITEILGNDFMDKKKRSFLKDLLVKYDLVIPKTKVDVFSQSTQSYLIPFLFPNKKPDKILLFDNKIDPKEIKTDQEWNIKYFLPFKPSSMWKILFLKIRKCCIKNERVQIVEDEFYWKDGFVFGFFDVSYSKKKDSVNHKNTIKIEEKNSQQDFKKNKEDNSTIVQLDIHENKSTERDAKKLHVILEINIKSNNKIEELFENIHQSVKEFISKWNVGNFYQQIKFFVEKKSVGKEEIFILDSSHSNNLKIICYYCNHSIVVNKNTTECEMCLSKNFLIEKEFAVISIIAQGEYFFFF